MRILRDYFRRARICHFCDHCFHYIEQGDRYSATVIAIGGRRLIVMKRHDFCPVDPDEEERGMMEQIDEWEETQQDEEWPIAA